MDLAELLISHGDDAPSGENLEYDPAFISLELAAQPGEERQVGDAIIAAEEPDHSDVITHAVDVLGRSHDLRAAVFLSYSLLRTQGFPGFAAATGYIRGVLEQYWDTCHPELDADDDNDPTMRVNAVKSLSDMKTTVAGVRLAPLTESRAFGRFSLRDMMMLKGEIDVPEGADNLPTQEQISAAFQDTPDEKLQEILVAVTKASDDIKAIGAVFDDKVPGEGPNLELLEVALRKTLVALRDHGVGASAESAEDGGDDAGDDGAAAADGGTDAAASRGGAGRAAGGGGAPGAINSQQDVRNTIDRLINYYRRAEPSSPVPLILERAKRLVGADFLTIIKDMAPDGRSNVNVVGGISDDEEY